MAVDMALRRHMMRGAEWLKALNPIEDGREDEVENQQEESNLIV